MDSDRKETIPKTDLNPDTIPFRRRSSGANGPAPTRTAASNQTKKPAINRIISILCLLWVLGSFVGLLRKPDASRTRAELAARQQLQTDALLLELQTRADELGEEPRPFDLSEWTTANGQQFVFEMEPGTAQNGKFNLDQIMKLAKANFGHGTESAGTVGEDGVLELPSDGTRFEFEVPGGDLMTLGMPKLEVLEEQMECLLRVDGSGNILKTNETLEERTLTETLNPDLNDERTSKGEPLCAIFIRHPSQSASDDDTDDEIYYLGDFDPGVSWNYAILPSPSAPLLLDPSAPHGSAEWMSYHAARVKEMFFHALYSYLLNAYPADELLPLSCSGTNNLGGLSATLIDSLDTLAVLGEWELFETCVGIVGNVDFDVDESVSVFETNIRVLGGLLSAHLLAASNLPTYNGKLLSSAWDLGKRLVKAFEASGTSGMPFGSVNLRHGVSGGETESTCTACVGTYALEFGWLSLLTGDPSFEKAARRAIRSLMKCVTPLGLFGGHINITSGAWIHAEASVGADSDSFYEYLFKSYFAFSDEEEYGDIGAQAMEGIRAHLKKGVWHFDVHSGTGTTVFTWHHSLSAFLPGLKVLRGDLVEAQDEVWGSKMVMDRCNGFLPEQFDLRTASLLQGRTHYPLRPEFVESLWYLHKATRDPWLLDWAARFVANLEGTTKVQCGFAGVADVGTGDLADRMDSFLLSETLKYLYLVFDAGNGFNGEGWMFTTEAHVLPVTDRRGWRGGKWVGVEGRKRRKRKDGKEAPKPAPGYRTNAPPLPDGIPQSDPEADPFFSAIHTASVSSYRDRSRAAWDAKVCDYGEWQEAVEARIWGRPIWGSRIRG